MRRKYGRFTVNAVCQVVEHLRQRLAESLDCRKHLRIHDGVTLRLQVVVGGNVVLLFLLPKKEGDERKVMPKIRTSYGTIQLEELLAQLLILVHLVQCQTTLMLLILIKWSRLPNSLRRSCMIL
jgi:hypothetical protein